MTHLSDELRLLIFVAVQSFILFASWTFVSRYIDSRLQRLIDTLLLTYLIQYIAVGLPGMIGLLSPIAMLVVAGVIAALLFLTPSPGTPGEGGGEGSASTLRSLRGLAEPAPNPLPAYRARAQHAYLVLAGLLLVAGYVAAFVWYQAWLPPMSTDALTYHFPAAVQWLQHGRIDLFQTWFFNPANTYSPLAGSMFYAWLLGPIGNDTLAHFASAPMVVLIFLATVSIARSLGGGALTAVLAGIAIALSRPIVGQIDKGKDDLFLAAFFAVAAGGLSPKRLADPLGPWRVGVAIGLCLATKYTALLAMPMLLLAADAPFRLGSRKAMVRCVATIAATAIVIAGPWYLRNLVATGNPFFPTDLLGFKGLFSTTRSLELRTYEGVMGVFLSGPFAIPGAMCITLMSAWAIALGFGARELMRDPLVRLCLIGPFVGLAVFIVNSPYPEIRFIVPALLLMFGSLGVIWPRWSWILIAVVTLSSTFTGLDSSLFSTLARFIGTGVVFAGLGVGCVLLQQRVLHWQRDRLAIASLIVILLIVGYAYVNWGVFVRDRAAAAAEAWAGDGRGKLWAFVRNDLPAGPIAYTGTFTVYPLMGYRLDRPVTYAPVKSGVRTIADLPRLGDHLPGEEIQTAIIPATVAGADQNTWIGNLKSSGSKYLVVFKNDVKPPPIESEWAQSQPLFFVPLYSDAAGDVYGIRPW